MLYSRSLAIERGDLLRLLVRPVTGRLGLVQRGPPAADARPFSCTAYVTHAEFWASTLQKWQSEFLAVGAMAALSIYLRQRGSPESKPVGEPHSSTGSEG